MFFPCSITSGQHFLRRPKTQDWERFDYYAPRVRRFGHLWRRCREQDMLNRYNAVLDLLSKSRTYLLPNVRECLLDFTDTSSSPLPPDHNPIYRLYLGPAVTSIQISTNSYDDSHFDLLRSDLVSLDPQIQHLTVASRDSISGKASPRADAGVFTLISSLHDLRTLHFTDIIFPQSIITHLATQSSLTMLMSIYVPSSHVGTFAAAGFSSLKGLHLIIEGWSSALSILSSMNCKFTSLSVECFDNSESLPIIRDFIETLRPSFETLSTFALQSYSVTFSAFDLGTEGLDVIRPLLLCKQLRDVTLHLNFLEVLDDSCLLETISAWPLLESFSLMRAGAWGVFQRPRMTLKGLVSLIRHFPRLQVLHLSLSLHEADISLFNGISTSHIRLLELKPIVQQETLEKFSQALKNLFPKYYRVPSFSPCIVLRRD